MIHSRIVFWNIVLFEIEKRTLTSLLKGNDYPHILLGICFEKLITLFLEHNKLYINDLNFEKDNIIEVNEMTQLKENRYEGQKFDLSNNGKDTLIIQKKFFGPIYDLLIITKDNEGYYSDFIQIGVDKTKQQINKIVNDLKSKYCIYKNNI